MVIEEGRLAGRYGAPEHWRALALLAADACDRDRSFTIGCFDLRASLAVGHRIRRWCELDKGATLSYMREFSRTQAAPKIEKVKVSTITQEISWESLAGKTNQNQLTRRQKRQSLNMHSIRILYKP